MKAKSIIGFFLMAILVACQAPTKREQIQNFERDYPVFTKFNIVDSTKVFKTKSGLEITMIQEGLGNIPTRGSNVVVEYVGFLENGKQFDNSFNREQPLEVIAGANKVIRGWDEALLKLPLGSKAILKIPPELGYGVKGLPPVIPENSTLIFHLYLVGAF